MKHSRLVFLESLSQEELIMELRVLSTLVFDATQLIDCRAAVGSSAWESWARCARPTLKHEAVDAARKL
jgi:hypothetical protein